MYKKKEYGNRSDTKADAKRQAEDALCVIGRKIHQWFMQREMSHPRNQGIVHYKGLHITYSPKTQNYYLCNKTATCYYDLGHKDVVDLLLTYSFYLEKGAGC